MLSNLTPLRRFGFHKLALFLVFASCLTQFTTASSHNIIYCSHNDHCPSCFLCSSTGVCVGVPEGTDPLNDCGMFCDIPMVCSMEQHCALTEEPSCECDYVSGNCVNSLPKTYASKVVSDSQSDGLYKEHYLNGRETVEQALANGEQADWERRARRRGPEYQLLPTHVALACIGGIFVCICIAIACVNSFGKKKALE